MSTYLARRCVHAVLVLFVAISLVFFVGRVLGDPIAIRDPFLPAEAHAALARSYGLDRPIHVQYVEYLGGVVRGDLGVSMWQRRPVLTLVLERLPATFVLTLSTLALAIPLGLAGGIAAAVRPGSAIDRLMTTLSLAGVSVVEFWIGLMLVILFAVQLKLLPTGGFGGLNQVILPAVTLSLPLIGRIGQLTRVTMIEQMNSQYVTFARSRGLPEHIVVEHAFRNALIPIITLIGLDFAQLMGGTAVIETIFAWPGVGSLMIRGITERDMVLVQGTVFILASIVVAVNLLIDLAYAALDPRISHT